MSSQPTLRDLDSLADRIRQHRQVSATPIVIVEGPDDKLVLGPHLADFEVMPADGRTNAIEAAKQLIDWGIPNIVVVYDQDFAPPELDVHSVAHPYDGRDLEFMLIRLGVLALVLDHQGSEKKLVSVGGSAAFVETLINNSEPVTQLRKANAKHNLGLAFDQIDLASKADSKTMAIKIQPLHAALIAVSNVVMNQKELLEKVDGCDDGLGPRGRDVVALAGLALRSSVGTLRSAATTVDVLTSQLHSSSGLALERSEWVRALRRKLAPN